MDFQLILVMFISLVVVLPIIGYIVHIVDRKDKIKVNLGTAMYINSSKKNSWHKSYLFLTNLFLTRGYMDKIARRYELLYPGDMKTIASKTVKVAFTIWLFSALEIFLIFCMRPNLQNGILAVFLIFVINSEVLNAQVNSAETKLLEEMAEFISDVRHNYHINRMVDDAILSSLEGLGSEMRLHANRLYDIVISNNLSEDVLKYNTTTHNKYLKMLLALCTSIIEFNDKKINGQLLFTANLNI